MICPHVRVLVSKTSVSSIAYLLLLRFVETRLQMLVVFLRSRQNALRQPISVDLGRQGRQGQPAIATKRQTEWCVCVFCAQASPFSAEWRSGEPWHRA